ncbi:tannase family, partial [Rhizoctonia solani]
MLVSTNQIDFGWRAVHLSTIFSKVIVNAYYGQNSSYNYWFGCSSGGKQGMREVQGFPGDFDGALTGAREFPSVFKITHCLLVDDAAAQWLSRQNGFNIHVGQLNMNETTPGEVVPTSFFPTWAQEVLAQCDEIDGVKDNVILNPRLCTPDTSTVVCGASNLSAYVNSSTCITEGQATTLAAVYKNWTSSATGELLFPSYDPGSESGWTALLSGTPFGLSCGLTQVYNYTSLQPALVVKNETELERITAIGDETDPGQGNAVNPNLTPFFQRGGKLIAYHGSADMNIPSGSSTHYYERLQTYYNRSTDLRNYYRLFLVPGMGHCEGGNGADGFGRPQQQSNGQGQSLVFDAEHDAILALMRWVENGTAPNQIISAKYVDNDKSQGVEFTRLLCPYPQEGKYVSGDVNNSTSYVCE